MEFEFGRVKGKAVFGAGGEEEVEDGEKGIKGAGWEGASMEKMEFNSFFFGGGGWLCGGWG